MISPSTIETCCQYHNVAAGIEVMLQNCCKLGMHRRRHAALEVYTSHQQVHKSASATELETLLFFETPACTSVTDCKPRFGECERPTHTSAVVNQASQFEGVSVTTHLTHSCGMVCFGKVR